MNNTEKIYSFLMMIFISMIVLTNIIGVKIFEFSPFFLDKNITLTTGIITYPLTFLKELLLIL